MSHAVHSPARPDVSSLTPALEVRGLGKSFHIGGLFSSQAVRALHGVDLTIGRGEIVALVGEIRFRQEHPGPLCRPARETQRRGHPGRRRRGPQT